MQRSILICIFIALLLLSTSALIAANRNELDAKEKQATEEKIATEKTPDVKSVEIQTPATSTTPTQLTVEDIVIPAEYQDKLAKSVSGMSADDAASLVTRAIMAGEDINWQVICGGGGINGSSTNYRLSGAVGQVAVGTGTSTDYAVHSGFWQNFQAVNNECNVAGDANNDGDVNIGDIVYIIAYIFRGGPPPELVNQSDVNEDCGINLGDAVYLINYAFRSGPAPTCGCMFAK
ncbi:MAG: dockerin type I repeat-containing protein [Candidatus Zixiibacteriota bacterium]